MRAVLTKKNITIVNLGQFEDDNSNSKINSLQV